jgi:uncharacterized protein YjiS (DUF1127 family)
MAYVNTRSSSVGFGDRIALMVKAAKVAMDRRALYSRTIRELQVLSDRDLSDLGVSRFDIPALAHEAAYGK